MESEKIICSRCKEENPSSRYFCLKCGRFLKEDKMEEQTLWETQELKLARVIENLHQMPHTSVVWNDLADFYTQKVERFQAISRLPEFSDKIQPGIFEEMEDFLHRCRNPEFQVAFVGTIKTGKSTLINALLGRNYASVSVTPETAALTKFRRSDNDYLLLTFYTEAEWEALWKSRRHGEESFEREYHELHADDMKEEWIGKEPLRIELQNDQVEAALRQWTSSQSAHHFFVKEVEVGISSLKEEIPSHVVLVDTPGLSDPVAYRSELSKQYIRSADAVFVCIDATKLQAEEIKTLTSVFAISSNDRSKVHVIATHLDTLPSPKEDWEKQKKHFVKELSGKTCFNDQNLAEKNIIPSTAYIYELCGRYCPSDIEIDDKAYDDALDILRFARRFGIRFSPGNDQGLSDIIELTNIPRIRQTVFGELVGKADNYVLEKLRKEYTSIKRALKVFREEYIKDTAKRMIAMNQTIDTIEKSIVLVSENNAKLQREQSQLNGILAGVKHRGERQLEKIVRDLDKVKR